MSLEATVLAALAGFFSGGWLLYWLVYKPIQERYHADTVGDRP